MRAISPDAFAILPVSARARAIVRAASASADKTWFAAGVTSDTAIAEAVAAGYLAPLRGHADVWRITARGETYLARLRSAH